jgi:hypothetical protein
VIAHDPSSDFKQKLAATPVPTFTKVIGVEKLRKNYKEYKSRRELADRYDLFVADERVVRMLPQLLGKTFYEKKKVPVPVRLDRATWPRELATARDSTHVLVGWGQTMSVRVGRSDMTAAEVGGGGTRGAACPCGVGAHALDCRLPPTPLAQVAENIMAVVGPAVAHVAKKWRGVQVRT